MLQHFKIGANHYIVASSMNSRKFLICIFFASLLFGCGRLDRALYDLGRHSSGSDDSIRLINYIPPDTDTLLFNGSGSPESHAWANKNFLSELITTEVHSGHADADLFRAKTRYCATNQYMLDTGFDEFYVAIRVAVFSGSYNLHDAGFAFSPVGNRYYIDATGGDDEIYSHRSIGLYIAHDRVGFQDLTAEHFLDATYFHNYSIWFKNNEVKVYLDSTYDQINSGGGNLILNRTIPPLIDDFYPPGYLSVKYKKGAIAFGDTSNDGCTWRWDPAQSHLTGHWFGWVYDTSSHNTVAPVNSSYAIDYITFKGL
jgi:hypothetical protein